MPGIDLLISRTLSEEIKKKIEKNLLNKIERELFFEHGMSIKLSIEHCDKLHNVLKKNLTIDVKQFEKDCLKKIIQLNKTDNNYTIKIIDSKLSEKILDFYGDAETRKILQSVMDKSKTISQILSSSKVLKSPAYRKIENLLLAGLLIESGMILKNTKRISRYRCVFQKIIVKIIDDGIDLEGHVDAKIFKESSLVKMEFVI